MITTAPFRLTFKFEHWVPVIGVEPTTGDQIITGSTKVNEAYGMVIPVQGGMALVTREQMNVDDEVRNLRDRGGKNLLTVGSGDATYYMFVASVEPVLNPMGLVIGYRHNLRRAAS